MEARKSSKGVAQNSGIVLFGKMTGNVIKLGVNVLLARFLGVISYGLYTLGYEMTVNLARNLSTFGLENAIVKFVSISKSKDKFEEVKGTALSCFSISLLISLIFASLLFFFSNIIAITVFRKPDLGYVLQMFSISLPFYVFMLMASAFARAYQKMQYDVGVKNITQPLLNMIITAILLIIGMKLGGAIIGFLASSIFASIIGFFIVIKLFPGLFGSIKAIYKPRRLLNFSFFAFLSGFLTLVLLSTDKIMLGILDSSASVGVYTAASKIAIQMLIILTSINFAFDPMIAQLFHTGRLKELDKQFKSTTRWIITLTLPVFLIFIFYSKDIMLLFGHEFVVIGSLVLIILSFSQIFDSFTGSTQRLLLMTKYHKLTLANSIAAAIINIILNIFLISMYGAVGAAVGTGISIAMLNIARLVEVRLLLGMFPYNLNSLKPVIIALSITAIFLAFKGYIITIPMKIITAALILICYLLMVFALGLEIEDKHLIKQAIKKIGVIK